ncbi:MAG: hypothetical protein KBA55_14590 [Ruminococcus sp.]|nr:hypothetical protein [Ruminococcus sp.]
MHKLKDLLPAAVSLLLAVGMVAAMTGEIFFTAPPLIVPSGALFRFPPEIAAGAIVLTIAAWIIAHRQAILTKVLRQN